MAFLSHNCYYHCRVCRVGCAQSAVWSVSVSSGHPPCLQPFLSLAVHFFFSSLIILQECGSWWPGSLELCLPFSDWDLKDEPLSRREMLLWTKPHTSASAAGRPHSCLQALDPAQNLHTALGASDLFPRHYTCWDCSSLFRSEIQSTWVWSIAFLNNKVNLENTDWSFPRKRDGFHFFQAPLRLSEMFPQFARGRFYF